MRTFYIVMFILNVLCTLCAFGVFLRNIVYGFIEDEDFKKKSRYFVIAFVFLALFIFFLLTSIAMGLNPWESVELA